jgi:hypothetical protein
MGFPSPAADYVEQRLSVNSICKLGPQTSHTMRALRAVGRGAKSGAGDR